MKDGSKLQRAFSRISRHTCTHTHTQRQTNQSLSHSWEFSVCQANLLNAQTCQSWCWWWILYRTNPITELAQFKIWRQLSDWPITYQHMLCLKLADLTYTLLNSLLSSPVPFSPSRIITKLCNAWSNQASKQLVPTWRCRRIQQSALIIRLCVNLICASFCDLNYIGESCKDAATYHAFLGEQADPQATR